MKKCPRCNSPKPELHPAVQFEGEVNPCSDDFHKPKVKAQVILFKPQGKYYTEEEWEIPEHAIGPYDMRDSKDFRRIDNGPVLVITQEPWGYPHLLVHLPEMDLL